jgi:hypothetical protein
MTNIIKSEFKNENTAYDCLICCENIESKLVVKCLFCKEICCQECFQQYILTKNLKISCMFCGKNNNMQLDLDFIVLNTNEEWWKKIYKKHRMELLWIEESQRLKDITTQKEARAYIEANIFRYSTSENGNLKIGDTDLNQIIYYNGNLCHISNIDKIRKAQLTIRNSIICIEQYGKGWGDFDFGKSEPRAINNSNSLSIQCPSTNCHGIIYNETCDLCGCAICKECHEIIKNTNHICNPSTVASIKMINYGSKPCPKCITPISKIDGCDQMFCTQCHTSFSWMTGSIITKGIHNPHYFEWLEKSGQLRIPRRLEEGNNCEEYISYANLLSCFDRDELLEAKNIEKNLPKISNLKDELPSIYHYVIAFKNLWTNILNIRATSGNHANMTNPDYHNLRIQFLVNEIDADTMKQKIEEQDFEYQKMMLYWQIYSTTFLFSTILFDNLFTFTNKRTKIKITREKFMYDIYLQFQNLLEYSNKCLTYYDKVFGKDNRLEHFQPHPYVKIVNKNQQIN